MKIKLTALYAMIVKITAVCTINLITAVYYAMKVKILSLYYKHNDCSSLYFEG